MKRFSLIILLNFIPFSMQGMENAKKSPIFFKTIGTQGQARNGQLTTVYVQPGATLADAIKQYKLDKHITTNKFTVKNSVNDDKPFAGGLEAYVITEHGWSYGEQGGMQILLVSPQGTFSNERDFPVIIDFNSNNQ
jgi:hypothetical protein